jgi:hypothetical protein
MPIHKVIFAPNLQYFALPALVHLWHSPLLFQEAQGLMIFICQVNRASQAV